jgi:CubicO group peptidase (beta-lactamase class C family)
LRQLKYKVSVWARNLEKKIEGLFDKSWRPSKIREEPAIKPSPKSGFWSFKIKFLAVLLTVPALYTRGSLPAFADQAPAAQTDYTSTKENLKAYIEKEMGRDNVKGLSLALVDGGRVVWQEGFGVADEKNQIPATADTLYRVDSVSKVLTAMEVMRLAARGRIGLDEPIEEALPGFFIQSRFKQAKPITVRSLLAHHSGLPADYHQGMWVENAESLGQLIGDLKEDYLVAPPQSFYKYSDLDYSLLGRIIELKSRRPFAQAMRDDLLKPLGMDSSTFDLNPAVRERLAKGYDGGKETPPLYLRDTPAGGMVSSANDMARLIRFLFTGRPGLVGQKALDSMYDEQYAGLPLDFGHHMGLGWMLNGLGVDDSKTLAWHDGDYVPYFCRVALFTKERLGVVVLSNCAESRLLVRDLALRALKLMREAKYGVPADLTKPKVVMPALVAVPEEKINRFVGFYSGIGKAAEISKGGSHLRADLMDHQFDLVPTAENKFIPRIMILFFPIHIPQYGVEFTTVEGRDVAILSGLGDPVVFEKIHPAAIPLAWRECLGKYRLDDPDGETQFKDMSLEDRAGILTVNARITSKVFDVTDTDYLITLQSISNDDAVISGLFYPDGDTVHASREGGRIRLYYAGLRFTKTDPPGCCSNGEVASK